MLKRIIVFLENNSDLIVHAVAALLLFSGFCYSFYLGNHLRFPDEKVYFALAENLLKGLGYTLDGVHPSSWRTPGYPLFLSVFMLLGANTTMLRFLNFIALAGCLYLMRSILRKEQAGASAGLAALLLLQYGVLFYTAGTLYPQTLFSFFLLLLYRVTIVDCFGYRHAVLFGLISAVLIFLHPTAIFIPPLIILGLFLPKNFHIIGKGIVAALVILLAFVPWIYRNYLIYHAIVPISVHGGDTLYWGNNPNTDVDAWYKTITKEVEQPTEGMTEVEEDKYYKKLVWQFWTKQPGKALELYLKKLLYHFNYKNQYFVKSEGSDLKALIMFITYYPLLLCLVIRLFLSRKIRLSRTEFLFASLYIGSALFHAIFLTRIRFRLPYDIMLITHIGIMFSLLSAWVQGKAREGHAVSSPRS